MKTMKRASIHSKTLAHKLFHNHLFIIILVMVSVVYLIRAEGGVFKSLIGESLRQSDTLTDDSHRFDWYAVSDEAVQECSLTKSATSEHEPRITTGSGKADVYALSTTLQAQKSRQENGTLYEVAWYIQPVNNDLAYNINVVDDLGNRKSITGGQKTAQHTTGDSGYWSEISDKKYVSVEWNIENRQPKTYLFVEKK